MWLKVSHHPVSTCVYVSNQPKPHTNPGYFILFQLVQENPPQHHGAREEALVIAAVTI